jgi:type III restriction enzyme
MKLQFEPNLDYQLQAIEAVCDLFRGQETCRTEFTVTPNALGLQGALAYEETSLGIGNRLTLLDDQLLENLTEVQLRNGLAPSEKLDSGDFTVEMETGTGKTYVYLRTIFELNKRYGFTKFVIVVPSVAIKEGVNATLNSTQEHFKSLYSGVPFDHFLYDSGKLGQVRNFATSPHIQIMVVTVGAINKKDVNNLYKDSEKTGGEKPIDLIRATRPIVIVDEPQSVDGGLDGRGKQALNEMNPLCTLRYSATHVTKHHMVYRLDAVDAYERKLVKQIEVAAATVENAHNRPFVRIVSVTNQRGTITAKVELDVASNKNVVRKEEIVQDGDDLEQVTGRSVYKDCRIGEIRVAKGNELVELRIPGDEKYLRKGQAHGDVNTGSVQREMIRRTIKEHLDKELRLRPQGIKVLSLFFIDSVEKYRKYDASGNPTKGEYALIFEEEYKRYAKHPDYNTLFEGADLSHSAEELHNGYFSIDKKGGWSEPDVNSEGELKNQSSRDDAERAYNLIMKEKEKLLSLETPLKFIFSHSALKEGWDNPNVFQICTLRDIQTERERRQTIGRGLRLCVNQKGERQRGFEINTLTVVATEKYEDFAEKLQREIEAETGIRFGIVEKHSFALQLGGAAPSQHLWEHLKAQGYINAQGKVQDSLKIALKNDTLIVPEELKAKIPQISQVLRKLAGGLEIKNADDRKSVGVRRAILDSPEFKALWDRIKHKTTYRVEFDNDKLLENCIKEIKEAAPIPKTRLQWRKADIAIGKSGVEATEKAGAATVNLDEGVIELPDLLTALQDRTQLTRRSLCHILTESGRLSDFKRNPQQFIDQTAELINRTKRSALVNGIKYQKLGESHYYAQELFAEQELKAYLEKNALAAKKAIHEYVIYDSATEKNFATELEHNTSVKVYAKLPGWFKVPTPLGTYNPDWAILIDTDGGERLYFVVETKSSLYTDDLRDKESNKIECGKAHFKALHVGESPAHYLVATKADDLWKHVGT